MDHIALVAGTGNRSRVVILCLGNEFRGDGGAGGAVGRLLRSHSDLTVVEAGDTPENHIGAVAALRPTLILFVDAMDYGGTPGEHDYFPAPGCYQLDISTHASLGMVVAMLESLTDADIALLGIQPKATAPGTGLSDDVASRIQSIAAEVIGLLGVAEQGDGS